MKIRRLQWHITMKYCCYIIEYEFVDVEPLFQTIYLSDKKTTNIIIKTIIPHNKNLALRWRKQMTAASPVDKTRDHKMESLSYWSHSPGKINQKDTL